MIIDTTQTKIERKMMDGKRWIEFWENPPDIISQLAHIQRVTDELIAQGYAKTLANHMIEPKRTCLEYV